MLGGGGLVSLVDGAVALLIQDLLGSSLDENVLLVFDEDRHAKSFFDALSFFKKSPVYYPGSKNQFRVPGFESEQNRARAGVIIKSVISGGVFCLSSKEAILNKDINKKLKLDKVSISLGKSFSIPFLIEKLVDFGYRNVEFVYHGGEFSSRGDIVYIYPESSKRPIRISFEFDVVESISYFNVDTQRSSRSCEFFTIYSLVGVSKTSGKNLLSFVPWSYVFYLKKRGDYWSFFSNSNKKMLKSHFKTISKPLLLDARFFKHITKNNRGKNFVFYTDPKRKGVLSKIGFSTIPGFLPGGCGVKLKNKTYFVDSVFLSKKPDVAVRKPLLINSLSQINPGDPVVHIVHGVARFSGLASRGRPGYEKEFVVKLD